MTVRLFALLDYVICGTCLFISIGIGVYHAFKGRHHKTTNEYYFGGKTMGTIPVTLSLIVTYQSSVFLLGMPAELYVYGTMFMWRFVGVIIGFVLISLLIAPLLHPLDIKTVYQYLELRYKHKAPRKLYSFLGLVVVALYLGLVLYGPAIALVTRIDDAFLQVAQQLIKLYETSPNSGLHTIGLQDNSSRPTSSSPGMKVDSPKKQTAQSTNSGGTCGC